jgi:Asp-tRNA(Asn)/Glu-tRNA(Gln) amidotransferase A subunit family amidase
MCSSIWFGVFEGYTWRHMASSRRQFLKRAGASLVVARGIRRTLAAAGFDPLEKTIPELQRGMARGEITSAQLVEFYLDRINAYDQTGPRVNAVLAINPNAAADARTLDEERRHGRSRGPLHGIPILLKDNFDTKDMPTTGGCLALSGVVPRTDAFQVRRLRDAGAVILGKVNLHELALGLTTVSSLGGQTLDPYDLRRAPGGSSGGSAVAATMNFAAATLGTDTSGSIRIPSCHNNVVGLRPSLGLSSRAGLIPFGHTQDTGGPIARTVEDVAVVLDATVGFDPADPVTASSKGKIPRTYTAFLERNALKGARIGVLAELFGAAPEDGEVGDVVRRALDAMKGRGATVIDVVVPNLAAQLRASNLLTQELKFYLGDYLRNSGGPVASVEELLASGLHLAQLQGILDVANAIPDDYLTTDDYRKCLAARDALAQTVAAVMDDRRLDALAYPVARRIAPPVGGNQIGSNAGLSAQTGMPAIAVPAGFVASGFPVGLELLGRPFAEPTLIALAYSFERSAGHRKPPTTTQRPPDETAAPSPIASDADTVRFEVTASGANSIPPARVPFSAAGPHAHARLRHGADVRIGRSGRRCVSASKDDTAERRRSSDSCEIGGAAHGRCNHAVGTGCRESEGREALRRRDQQARSAVECPRGSACAADLEGLRRRASLSRRC